MEQGAGDQVPVAEYTSGSLDGSGYNVTGVFGSANWTDDLLRAFLDAADTLSTIITDDLADITADFGRGRACAPLTMLRARPPRRPSTSGGTNTWSGTVLHEMLH